MFINAKLAVAATVAMSALVATAQPLPHVHNVHAKREAAGEAVTVVVTNYVTKYADAADVAAAVTSPVVEETVISVPTTSSKAAAPTTSSKAAATPATTSKAVVASSSAETSTSSAAASAPSSSSSSVSFPGGAKGIVYSPYKVGGCKTADEVKSDIAKLSGFSVIRIYGVDCDQVPNVLAALGEGQKVFLGIFDVANIESGLSTINDAIKAHGAGWSVVHTISIGNELVNNGAATVDQIAGYVKTARSVLSGFGYTGPVVSVDTFIAVINNPGLCALSDYMAVNAHSFFDGNILAKDSGDWVLQQIQRVWSACSSAGSEKDVLITESGWPSRGESHGVAVPSLENQKAAISSIKEKVADSCILFTAFNDLWKEDGPMSAEKYYGIYGDN